MNTYDIKCTNCSEETLVTTKDKPRFCALCGSAGIVLKNISGVDFAEEVQSTHPKAPVEKCVAPKYDDTPTCFNIGDCEDFGTLDSFTFEVKDAPKQGSDEWLAWRKDGITATEAATLMFPDQYSTPMKVYTDKLGITQNDQSDPDGFFEWGHILEDDLVRKFKSVHPELADSVTQGRLYQRGFAKCSLDAQCVKDGKPVIIECKSSQSMAKWNPIPDRYFAQVQWQMFVTGVHSAIIIAVICEGGYHYIEREVQYSESFVKQMVEKAQ